ncbi:MAG TPA: zinc-ribbon domain containing protein [Clostridium sp.]
MEDKILICQDCQEEFVFTVGEQEFFEEKEFSEPKRCPACRRARKEERNNRE